VSMAEAFTPKETAKVLNDGYFNVVFGRTLFNIKK